jgi:hypothetical protein
MSLFRSSVRSREMESFFKGGHLALNNRKGPRLERDRMPVVNQRF